jgi:hypothetical protein
MTCFGQVKTAKLHITQQAKSRNVHNFKSEKVLATALIFHFFKFQLNYDFLVRPIFISYETAISVSNRRKFDVADL